MRRFPRRCAFATVEAHRPIAAPAAAIRSATARAKQPMIDRQSNAAIPKLRQQFDRLDRIVMSQAVSVVGEKHEEGARDEERYLN